MKALGSSKNLTIVAMLVVAVLAIAFWMLALAPKREEAAKLGDEVAQVEASLAGHRAEVAEAEAARDEFPVDYQKLVVLGKAVPGDDDTASLLVQMTGLSQRAGVNFREILLSTDGGSGAEAAPAAPPPPTGTPVSATEATASLLPLGASVGPAGLAVMPYTLTFKGDFFEIADFIKGLDSLVKTNDEGVVVDGRLITVDGFSLKADEAGFPALQASFAVTTYLTPPSQGVTAGATPESPGAEVATPAATTTGGTP